MIDQTNDPEPMIGPYFIGQVTDLGTVSQIRVNLVTGEVDVTVLQCQGQCVDEIEEDGFEWVNHRRCPRLTFRAEAAA